MHSCQFCDAGIAVVDGAVVPGKAMVAALEKGYAPTMCPRWSAMNQRVTVAMEREQASRSDSTSDPVTEGAVLFRWNAILREPGTTWRLCNACFSTLGPYLPPRPLNPSERVAQEAWDEMKYVLPVHCSIWAILAGYAGLFAVLVFPAPIALILGIVALWHINKHKEEKLGGTGRAIFGIVMGAIFSILIVVFLFLIAFGG